jgi:putative oxidoreductase
MNNTTLTDVLSLVGRVLLVWLFLVSGYDKIGGFTGTAGYIASRGLPMPEVLAGAALVLELLGSLLIVVGFKARWAAAALAAFTLVASFVFHNYWTMPEAQQAVQKLMFLKNLSIAGGLLLLVAFGPGRWAVDRR